MTRSDSAGPSGYDYLPAADYDDAEFNPASDYADDGFVTAWPQIDEAELTPPESPKPPSQTKCRPPESPAAKADVAPPEPAVPAPPEPQTLEPKRTEPAAEPVPEPAPEPDAAELPSARPIRARATGLRTRAGRVYRPVRARLAQTQLDWPRLPQARPADPARSSSLRARLARYGRRCLGPAGFVVLGVVLFAAYLAQARTIPGTSEGGGQALQAWEMLHGNLLLRGWTMSDVSFYTTELPEYMLVEWIHGLNADTVHVAAALSYTLIVLLGGLVAKGRATGREGLIRFFIPVGIMLAPPLSNTALLLGDPDHTGTHVPLLLIFLVLDRAPRRWWAPVLITIMLTWAQVADTIVLYEGAVPIALAGLLRVNRRRGKLAGNWFDLSLTLGAAISAVAAKHIVTLIKDAGGFIVKTPNLRFTTASALQQGIFTDFSRTLDVFGAKFFGMRVGADAVGTLLRLAGLALVIWAVAAGVRRIYRADTEIIVQVLTLGFLLLLIAYLVSTKNDENEIVGLLPLGAVLAGRLLTPPVIRNKLVPVLAVVLVLYAGMLAANTTKPANMGRDTEFGAWLKARGLTYGLGNFWNSTNTTVDTGGRVMVRPVRTFDDRIVTTLSESSGAWYNPRLHYANFIVSSRWWLCGGVCVGLHSARQSFGPPAVTYSFRNWRVLVYNRNLLARLRIVSWCDEGWPWNTPKAPSPVVCRS